MITCFLKYTVDSDKLDDFEKYGRMWIPLVEKFGGMHHGYFLPSEGASDIAYALFSFPSLSKYEEYRTLSKADIECQKAIEFAKESGCMVRFERSFLRPVLDQKIPSTNV